MPESAGAEKDLLEDAPGPARAKSARSAKSERTNRSETSDETARREIGGPEGPEPTRYGDWERNGRCTDF